MKAVTIEQFRTIFPFSKGNHELVENIVAKGLRQSFGENTMLYWEGDSCSHIALVLSGDLRVYKAGETGREITLYEIGPGETCILNASCILSNMDYPANAKTLSRVEAILLPAYEFSAMLDSHAQLRAFVFNIISRRLASIMALLEEVVFNRMDERLDDYLLEKSEDGLLEATHQAIANDLGTSREVVSRLLKDFERKGRVRLSRNSIELLDL